MKSHFLCVGIMLGLSVFLSGCQGSGGGDGDSTLNFSGGEGFWYLTGLEVDGNRLAHVALSESIEVSTSSLVVRSYSLGCTHTQTFQMNNGIPDVSSRSVTCSPSNCELEYYFSDGFSTDYASVMCGEAVNNVESVQIRKTATNLAEVSVDYTNGTNVLLEYRRLLNFQNDACGLLESFTKNGADVGAQNSYLDCQDEDGLFEMALFEDGTGYLENTSGDFEAFWWEDPENCLLNFMVYDSFGTLAYFYANSIQDTLGSGYIHTFKFYKGSGSDGYSPQSATCNWYPYP